MSEPSPVWESRRRLLRFLAGSPLEMVMRQAGTTAVADITPDYVVDTRG